MEKALRIPTRPHYMGTVGDRVRNTHIHTNIYIMVWGVVEAWPCAALLACVMF